MLNSMINRISRLIDVKSIVTLVLTGGFIALTVGGQIGGEQFLTIYTIIIGFYFGTQVQRKADSAGNASAQDDSRKAEAQSQ